MAPDDAGAGHASTATRQARVEELERALGWALADLALIRRRAALDIARVHTMAIADLATDLLPFKDALEAAVAIDTHDVTALREGLELPRQQLLAALSRDDAAPCRSKGIDMDRPPAMAASAP